VQYVRKPWIYFLTTFAFSWTFWGSIIALGLEMGEMPAPLLFAIAGAAPTISALILTYASKEKGQIRDFWNRLVDYRRPGLTWILVALLLPVVLTCLAGLVDTLMGGRGLEMEGRFSDNLFSLIPFAVFTLFFGPLPEEMGWRGYALDGLQKKFGAIGSSFILGAFWAAWHLPLFFIPGSYQNQLGMELNGIGVFGLNLILQTIVITWIYNHASRSTLTAVLFHFSVNYSGEAFLLSMNGDNLLTAGWSLAAIGCLLAGIRKPGEY